MCQPSRFFPSLNDEDIYFCLEAKRLNALVSGRRRPLADAYVKGPVTG